MAHIRFLKKGQRKAKRWLHEKLRLRKLLLRLSLIANLSILTYFAYEYGYLTNIIETYNREVAPILESLINQLPL